VVIVVITVFFSLAGIKETGAQQTGGKTIHESKKGERIKS